MAPDTNPPDWFQQFKELNAARKAEEAPPAPKGSERRRHVRFEVDGARITLYREGLLSLVGLGKENKARVALDLSEGGLQVVARERLPIGAKVRIHLEIEKFKDAIEAAAVVRWCYQNAQKKADFHVGLQFTDLASLESRKIASMRDFFASPQYRALKDSKKKRRTDSDVLRMPK